VRNLQGEGFWLSLTGDRLVCHLTASDHVQFSDGRELALSKDDMEFSLPPRRCVSVTVNRRDDGGVSLHFAFRLPGSDVAIGVGVAPAGINAAEKFVEQLLNSYSDIRLIDRIHRPRPRPAPEPEPKPEPEPRVREEWISAPVSEEAHDLYRAVMARLTSTDT
jgi:hypothetical protein